MGCDIHLYIEYSTKNKTSSREITWRGFGGEINPGRNYLLFGIMSKGVRTDPTFTCEAKGVPNDSAYCSLNDNRMYISETLKNDDCVTLEKAKQWEKHGRKITNDGNGKPTWVEHPDWHSHSWLNTSEFEKVMEFYNTNPEFPEPDYEVVLSIMKKYEELGFNARIVFWFDN